MRTNTAHSQKAKVTVTLSNDLVSQIDRLVDSSGVSSRSQLVEEAVRGWLRDQAQKELEQQTEKYYLSLSKEERNEDRKWSKIAVRSAKHLWDK